MITTIAEMHAVVGKSCIANNHIDTIGSGRFCMNCYEIGVMI